MRIAVTGTTGQLVRSLLARAPAAGVEIVAIGRPELDLVRPADIHATLAPIQADCIVNAAAYTAVDKAESEPELAMAVNATGAGAVAAAAHALGLPLVQISTDYVFDGALPRPWREDDATGPLGVYGGSKLAGEQAVAAAGDDHAILRTAWVHSPYGANFVKTMLRLAESREEVGVVADQLGSPTYAPDLADAVIEIARRLVAEPRNASLRGIFHVAGTGETNWAGLAEAVFSASAKRGGSFARVRPIATAEYPTPARRPANSRLDCGRLAACYGLNLPHWRDSVQACVAELLDRPER
jgi:dTDP-4-dehydrorhamnose reductase